MKQNIFLSLGSNLGDRESNIAQATMALSINLSIREIKSSSYYESEPLYNIDQPKFLNSVVCCLSDLDPFEFLDVTRRIEQMLGRPKKREKNLDSEFVPSSVLPRSLERRTPLSWRRWSFSRRKLSRRRTWMKSKQQT